MSKIGNWFMDEFMPNVFLPVIMAFVLLMIAFVPLSIYSSNSCLDYGYPKSFITWNFETKCGRIVNQTEYVCSLNDIKSGECSAQK